MALYAVASIGLASDIPSGERDEDFLYWDDLSGSWFAEPAPAVTDLADTGQPTLAVRYIISLQGTFPARNSVSPLLGTISLFAGNFPPRGWAFCDGQILPIASNTALFSLIGTLYGGDGRTTFALPDLRGRVALHTGQGPGIDSVSLGERGGRNEHFHFMER